MKYVVSVSVEVEAEDDTSAAALGYTVLNDEVPVELTVQGLVSPARTVVFNFSQAKQLRSVGRATTSDELDTLIAKLEAQ